MTTYNRRIYRVDRIDFNNTPQDGFLNEKGEKISFYQYYKDRYNVEIKQESQPLLVHIDKKKEQENEIFLIPELCVMTGLSDDDRNNFHLMKSLDMVIKPNASQRLSKCQELIDLINENNFTK